MTEEPSYRVRLTDCGPQSIKVIRFLHTECGMELYEASGAVENLPMDIRTVSGPMSWGDAKSEILPIVEGLRALGAVVEWDFDYGDYD